jgi:glucose-1-phosphate thymidylyltransferase
VYFLRPDAFDVIEGLSPSGRGEFEITDVLNHYVGEGRFFWRRYDGQWSDAGTVESLLHASMAASRAAADGHLAAPPVADRRASKAPGPNEGAA